MSCIEILDGTGSGNKAKVNDLNQVYVYSESVPSEGIQSENGNSFILHGECTTSLSSNGGLMVITNNDPDYKIEITRIYIDPHTITPTDLIITQVFDAEVTGGTDKTSTGIVQKNRGIGSVLDASLFISDSSSDITYTGGVKYHAFPIKSMTSTQRNMNQTNIITAGKSILFGFKTVSGSNAVDGEVISFSVNVIKRKV